MNFRNATVWAAVAAFAAIVAVVACWVSGAGMFGGEAKQVRALRALWAAQRDYHSRDADGDGYLEYAESLELLKAEPPCSAPGYSFRVHPIAGEERAPDGGLLSGFILVAEPADPSANAHVMDHRGELRSMPASMLPKWLEETSAVGEPGGR